MSDGRTFERFHTTTRLVLKAAVDQCEADRRGVTTLDLMEALLWCERRFEDSGRNAVEVLARNGVTHENMLLSLAYHDDRGLLPGAHEDSIYSAEVWRAVRLADYAAVEGDVLPEHLVYGAAVAREGRSSLLIGFVNGMVTPRRLAVAYLQATGLPADQPLKTGRRRMPTPPTQQELTGWSELPRR